MLYKRGGFSAGEIATLRKYTHDLSFDEIYSPGYFYDGSQTDRTLTFVTLLGLMRLLRWASPFIGRNIPAIK